MTKEFRALKLELKTLTDDQTPGRFTGRASVYGTVDSYGDVVMPGAFTKTVLEHGGRIVICSQHDPSRTIGIGELSDEVDGLHITGTLLLDLQEARDEYARLKAGLISGLSIGYETIKEKFESGVRQLQEVRLWEVSLVTFPANAHARVTGVKGVQGVEDAVVAFVSELKDGRELSAANRTKLTGVIDGLDAVLGTLRDLLSATEPKANTSGTPDQGAATPEPIEPQTHSMLASIMADMKAAATARASV